MIARLKTIRITRFNIWVLILGLFIVLGAVAGIMVFIHGLVLTNLSNLVPWGLWITIDLSSIALSAGAFLFCAAVYLLGLKEFQPMAKTAAFIGIIGYTMAMLCLLVDIGRPDRFWHGYVFWNTHSVLWEVTMCIGLYFVVLIFENMPTFAKLKWLQTRFPKLARKMENVHHYAVYLAIAGLILSMLHQSSLGATYGVLISRPIWYRPGLAALFIISAGAGGISLTTFATWLSKRLNPNIKIREDLLDKISRFLGWWMVGYLYLRFWDVFSMTYTFQPGRAEGLNLLTQGPLSFNFWFGEILLGAAIPIVILLSKRLRENRLIRALALFLIVGGVVAYRWDTTLVGQLIVQTPMPSSSTPLFTTYFPSLVEFAVGAGVVAFGLLAFTLGVKYLKVVNHEKKMAHS
jgi:Ni/Fe-hydrogenase subunit HybB-like protein